VVVLLRERGRKRPDAKNILRHTVHFILRTLLRTLHSRHRTGCSGGFSETDGSSAPLRTNEPSKSHQQHSLITQILVRPSSTLGGAIERIQLLHLITVFKSATEIFPTIIDNKAVI
jgi:hypothetical protein